MLVIVSAVGEGGLKRHFSAEREILELMLLLLIICWIHYISACIFE